MSKELFNPLPLEKYSERKGPFKDPLAPKQKECGQYPFDFANPSYDNRTSDSISAGHYYGVGVRTPSGKESASSMSQGPIPQSSKCFSPNEIFEYEDKKG